jgi:oligopeptide/dipeptide ABC transporter ATP-binding protein
VHKTLGLISDVGFPDPAAIYGAFPHRLSGGMCEMALIAMALAQAPKLLVADEPTKWLDAIAAKTVLRVLHEAAAQAGLLMITHDLGAASSCNRMAVMYAGEIVEEGFTREVLDFPLHFYTGGLLQARPSRGMKPLRSAGLHLVDGEWGCRFRNRCDGADEKCEVHPRLRERMGRRKVRCHHA